MSRSTPLATVAAAVVLAWGVLSSPLPLSAQDAAAGTPRTVAFVGGTVHPVSGPPLAGATLVIAGDRIAAVGADVAPPAGAEVIDATGKHLYPGFLHPLTDLGLVEVDSVRGTVDTTEIGQVSSNIRAEVAFNADSFRLLPAVAGGVLSALVVPRGGVFSGTSAVMRLEGWNWQDMTVRAPVAMHLDWPQMASDEGDDAAAAEKARAEALAVIDDVLANARAYERGRAAGTADFEPRLEALLPVLSGELPLFLHARSHGQIESALDWAEENGFDNVVLVAGYDVARLADRIAAAGVAVILDRVHTRPARDWEPYDAPFTAAARLHQAGVRFAIAAGGASAGSENARNLPLETATAVAFGLPREVALEAITLRAAEILGVADRLGSLEAGKEATLFLVDGDPLEIMSHIERVWIAGKEVDLTADRQYRLYRKYDERPAGQ